MAKRDNSVKFKGVLDVYENTPYLIITEFEKKKDATIEKPYNLFEVLKEFNGREVSISVADSTPLEPIEE